ncbi:substrate-binding periplasmic protein [Bradyrhizobium sp.]|uniref:substrate-binding periplasmic protein n=1 Tax=Bradyrhizobium sp. TaxID=376 RepID=UPI003C22BF12
MRLVTERLLPFENLDDDEAPGLSVEVLRQVFAAMGRDASFEALPFNRDWMMIVRGEANGIFSTFRTSEREQICSFPDEPLGQTRWVLFIRKSDVGKLKFSSFDDLVGHDVAVRGPVPGLFEQPTVSPELWKFLREHHNMVQTASGAESLRMLAADRVDYAVVNLSSAMGEIVAMGLSGKIEPLLSRSANEEGVYVCFIRGCVDPTFVDAFSRALKQFKQTEAFQAIYRKYFP